MVSFLTECFKGFQNFNTVHLSQFTSSKTMTGIIPQGNTLNTDLVEEFEEKITVTKSSKATIPAGPSSSNGNSKVSLLSLHDDVFQEILSKLTYDDVAKLRLVFTISS